MRCRFGSLTHAQYSNASLIPGAFLCGRGKRGERFRPANTGRVWEPNYSNAAVMEEDVSLFSLPLHDVVFPYIFSHFDILEIWRFRTVCRRLMDIADEYFRVCFSLAIQDTHVADYFGAVHNILSKCEHLVEFRLVGLHYGSVVPASYSGAISKYKTLLTTLATQRVRLGESFGFLKLKRLCLERLELTETHKVIGRLAACCSRLEELVLCSTSPFDDEALELLTSQSDHTKLVKLTVRNVQIQGHSLLNLVAQCPNLKHLCVSVEFYNGLLHIPQVLLNRFC